MQRLGIRQDLQTFVIVPFSRFVFLQITINVFHRSSSTSGRQADHTRAPAKSWLGGRAANPRHSWHRAQYISRKLLRALCRFARVAKRQFKCRLFFPTRGVYNLMISYLSMKWYCIDGYSLRLRISEKVTVRMYKQPYFTPRHLENGEFVSTRWP